MDLGMSVLNQFQFKNIQSHPLMFIIMINGVFTRVLWSLTFWKNIFIVLNLFLDFKSLISQFRNQRKWLKFPNRKKSLKFPIHYHILSLSEKKLSQVKEIQI